MFQPADWNVRLHMSVSACWTLGTLVQGGVAGRLRLPRGVSHGARLPSPPVTWISVHRPACPAETQHEAPASAGQTLFLFFISPPPPTFSPSSHFSSTSPNRVRMSLNRTPALLAVTQGECERRGHAVFLRDGTGRMWRWEYGDSPRGSSRTPEQPCQTGPLVGTQTQPFWGVR